MAIELDGINIIDVGQTVPNTAILTDKTLAGDGVFDILMQATKLHLMEEYDSGRITGKEYSTVYLGALNAVLAQSIGYIKNHHETANINANVGLVRQKTATELAQTADEIPAGLAFNSTTDIDGLIADQKLLNAEQLSLIGSQVTQSENEVALTGQKIITELAQTDDDLTDARAAGHGYNTSNVLASLVLAQTEKIDADAMLTKQKTVTEVGAVSDTLPNDYALSAQVNVEGILEQQVRKGTAEVNLLAQKTATEVAQTNSTIPEDSNRIQTASYTVVTDSLAGRQKGLFSAQTDGFARDAEQKLAKIIVDPFVAQVAGGDVSTVPAELDDSGINAVLKVAKANINVATET